MILKLKEYSLGPVNRGTFVYLFKKSYCVIWKKNRQDVLLNAVEEIEKNFEIVKHKINKDN